jgi:hypothetical protein
MKDELLYPYETTAKTVALCILIVNFLNRKWEDKLL